MRRFLLLFAVILLLAAEPAMAAVSHPRKVVHARGIAGAIAVDGVHLVGYGGGGGRIALFDDRTRTTRKVKPGRDCTRVIPIDASDGFFLINCGMNGAEGPVTQQIVFDSRTDTAIDLFMLMCFGGRERTVDELAALAADAGHTLRGAGPVADGRTVLEFGQG